MAAGRAGVSAGAGGDGRALSATQAKPPAPPWLLNTLRGETARTEMPTPFESAQLNLYLFDLRRERVLREARAWFVGDFNPVSFSDLMAQVSGERNAAFRMVISYWDMAASLVTSGAVDADAFHAAHGEIFATFSKIQPYLAELRAAAREPGFCAHIEAVVMSAPDAEAVLARRREALREAAKSRAYTVTHSDT